MSSTFTAPVRHSRLMRIVLTGMLLVAASVAVVVFGQVGATATAAAPASIRTASVVRTAEPARQVEAGLAAQCAIVEEKQAAQAAADAAAAAKAAATAAAQKAVADAAAVRAAAARRAPVPVGSLNVWTAGWQAEINACRGGVDITAHYGQPTIAEHWSCGGSSFPTTAGTIVTITGLDAGTYRVAGVVAVLNAYTSHTNDIPAGYSLLFQTCRNGDSHYTQFVGLQKIG